MDTNKAEKIAKEIFKYIKQTLPKKREEGKKSPFYDKCVRFIADSTYDHEKKGYVDFPNVDGKEYRGSETMGDVRQISNEVIRLLNEQRKVKGWKNLVYNTIKIEEGASYWSRKSYTILDKISLLDNPCKDFVSIQKFLLKYGNYVLGDFVLFSAQMGGKRGVLWDEYGERLYLANKEKKCANILAELKAVRKTNDSVSCKFGTEDYIDPLERDYSAYHEVECEGERRNYLEITIKTPSGKVKYSQKIY